MQLVTITNWVQKREEKLHETHKENTRKQEKRTL
jgi:hypothetical protein